MDHPTRYRRFLEGFQKSSIIPSASGWVIVGPAQCCSRKVGRPCRDADHPTRVSIFCLSRINHGDATPFTCGLNSNREGLDAISAILMETRSAEPGPLRPSPSDLPMHDLESLSLVRLVRAPPSAATPPDAICWPSRLVVHSCHVRRLWISNGNGAKCQADRKMAS